MTCLFIKVEAVYTLCCCRYGVIPAFSRGRAREEPQAGKTGDSVIER